MDGACRLFRDTDNFSNMTPAARTLGKRLRFGYAAVLVALGCGFGIAGERVGSVLVLDAEHVTMVNESGRQRFLSALTVHRALVAERDSTASSTQAFAATLSAWTLQQARVEVFLRTLCGPGDGLCRDFDSLRQQQFEIAKLARALAGPSAAATVAQRQALETALGAYVESADRWVGDLSTRLAAETIAQIRLLRVWLLFMFIAAAAIMVFVKEPIIRRLQQERTRFDTLARERQRLAAVVESIHDAVAITDATGRIEWVNAGFIRLTGYSTDESLSRTSVELLHGIETDPASSAKIAHGITSGEGYSGEFLHYHRCGRAFWGVVECGAVRDATGTITGFIAIESDITKRKLIEDQSRLDAQALQQLNVELDQFVYAASHDLRAPLRAVASLAAWILEDDESIQAQTRERLRLIHVRVQRMGRMLDDILEYARLGRKEQPVGAPLNAATLVAEAVDTLGVPERFRIEIDASLLAVRVVRMPFFRVLHNLLVNALTHHDREVGLIVISVVETPAWYRFSVGDDGPGVPEQFRESIFEMFTTLKSRDQREGSGMGLAMVKKIVTQQGGSCGVGARAGRGAEFWFEWPKLSDADGFAPNAPAGGIAKESVTVSAEARLGLP